MRLMKLIPLVLGIGLLGYGSTQLMQARASLDWPAVEGEVFRSAVTVNRDEDSTTYVADIRYRFTVAETEHTGNRVKYRDFFSSDRSHAEDLVDNYPKGARVSVYYLPENPEEALLEPGVSPATYIMPAAGAVFLMFWLLMVATGRRKA